MRAYLSERRSALVALLASVFVLSSAAVASAQGEPAYDLSPVSTGFTAQVTEALTIGLPIAAGLIALSVGIAWVRKLLKSR